MDCEFLKIIIIKLQSYCSLKVKCIYGSKYEFQWPLGVKNQDCLYLCAVLQILEVGAIIDFQ